MINSALKILKLLNNAGFEAYIVGGYPRNYYLNFKSDDIDISTSAKYDDLKIIFPNIKFKNYDSMSLKYQNYLFDITTFRKEKKYTNVRYPIYEYTKNVLEDIARRDFTINALCINQNFEIIDFINSKKDLDNKIIRTIGDANRKIADDPLRILRAIRFATTLNFKLDYTLEKSIIKNVYLIKNLSYFRKKQELDKIFKSKNSIYGLKLIEKMNLDKYLDIEINNIKNTSSYLGIWYQINPSNKYPFLKKEKHFLNRLNILLESKLENYDIYIAGYEVSKVAGQITQIDLVNVYNQLEIKSFNDIDIDISTLQKIGINITIIKKDLEKKIINKKINNKYNDIYKYLKSKYKV